MYNDEVKPASWCAEFAALDIRNVGLPYAWEASYAGTPHQSAYRYERGEMLRALQQGDLLTAQFYSNSLATLRGDL